MISAILVGSLVIWFIATYHGHPVRPPAAGTISAERAIKTLEFILGDAGPHAAGSTENDAVRHRIVQHLESMGFEVAQTPFEVNGVSMCNLLTSIPGDVSRRPILLATHYDSVPWGPGAGDAGSCVVALLEAARILNEDRKSLPEQQLTRPVFFLFTDGEEWVPAIGHGLNGATHFASGESALFSRDPLLLNFDARGAAGPSLMFETSINNHELLTYALHALPRPAYTASSYVTVYNLLPNATDFTIFKREGLEGLNFGFIDQPHRYHTPDDTVANLDPRSVQHHGENALALTRHFLESEQDQFVARENAVFFSVFGRWIICYPESRAIPLAAALLALQSFGAWLSLRRGATLAGIAAAAVAIALALGLSLLCGLSMKLLEHNFERSSHGFGRFDPWLVGGLWLAALVAAICTLGWMSSKASPESTWTTVWMGWAIFGLVIAIALPGFSYLMLTIGMVPAVLSLLPHDKTRLSVVAVAAASVFLVPIAYQFGIALGPRMSVILAGLFTVMLSPVYPMLVGQHHQLQRSEVKLEPTTQASAIPATAT